MGTNNRKLVLHASLIVIFFMIATNTQSGWLFLIISLMAAALVVNVLLPRSVKKNARVVVKVPSELSVGEPAVIQVTVVNNGRMPLMLLNLVIKDLIADRKITVQFLKKGEEWSERIPVTPKQRGIFDSLLIDAYCSAPFGIYSGWGTKWMVVQASPYVVLPRHSKLTYLAMPDNPSAELDTELSRQRRSQGAEYYGSREFRSEDSYRHVDWRATARTSKLMVKEFERYMNAPVNIVLDLSDQTTAGHEVFDEMREAAIECAMSLAELAGRMGRGYALASSGQPSEVLRPSGLRDALYWGAAFERTDETMLATVHKLSERTLSRSIDYVIFPSFKGLDPQVLLDLTLLKAHVTAVVLDARSYVEEPDQPDALQFDEETGEVRVAIASNLRTLKRGQKASQNALDLTMEQFEVKHLVDILAKNGIETLIIEKGCEIAECLEKPMSYISV